MAKYVFHNQEKHVVLVDSFESFDTTDQEKWEQLLETAEDDRGINVDFYPEEAPSDPAIWFEILQSCDSTSLERSREERWISDEKGYTEQSYMLYDDAGNQVMQASDDD